MQLQLSCLLKAQRLKPNYNLRKEKQIYFDANMGFAPRDKKEIAIEIVRLLADTIGLGLNRDALLRFLVSDNDLF